MRASTVVGRNRRFRPDPRLLLGILLVAGSVAGVVGIVAGAERTVDVYRAASPLSVGDTVTAEDLALAPVRLGAVGERYLRAGDLPAEGVAVLRSVGAGELLPVSAIGTTRGERLATVVVPIAGELPSRLVVGSSVDVWAAEDLGADGHAAPAVLASAAEVVRISDGAGLLAGSRGSAVEVQVPKESVARLLQALADGDAVSLVPIGEPLVR